MTEKKKWFLISMIDIMMGLIEGGLIFFVIVVGRSSLHSSPIGQLCYLGAFLVALGLSYFSSVLPKVIERCFWCDIKKQYVSLALFSIVGFTTAVTLVLTVIPLM